MRHCLIIGALGTLLVNCGGSPRGNVVTYLSNIIAVAGGTEQSTALKNDGTVWVWGWNLHSQLGDGTTTDRHTPVQVLGPGGSGYLSGITATAVGYEHTVALKDDGTVWAWGHNNYGQLGDGTTTESHTPIQVVGPGGSGYLTSITAIACGDNYSVAVKSDGTVWAWGYNSYGGLGDGTTADKNSPVQVLGPGGSGYLTGITAIACGCACTIALKNDGTVWGWGYNSYGDLGDGTTTDRHTPVQVLGPGGSGYLTGVAAIASNVHQTMALKNDGTVWTWGYNLYGELGDGTTTDRHTPVQVLGPGGSGYLTNITAIAVGFVYMTALKSDGSVWSWGYNGAGHLGDGTTTERHTPVQVLCQGGSGYLTGVSAITCGWDHSIALKNDGTVWTWGWNEVGQLGDGTTTDRHTPVQVVCP